MEGGHKSLGRLAPKVVGGGGLAAVQDLSGVG